MLSCLVEFLIYIRYASDRDNIVCIGYFSATFLKVVESHLQYHNPKKCLKFMTLCVCVCVGRGDALK